MKKNATLVYTNDIQKESDINQIERIFHNIFEENNEEKSIKDDYKIMVEQNCINERLKEIKQTLKNGTKNIIYVYDLENLVGFVEIEPFFHKDIRSAKILVFYLEEKYRKNHLQPMINMITMELDQAYDLDEITIDLQKTEKYLYDAFEKCNYIGENKYEDPLISMKHKFDKNLALKKRKTKKHEWNFNNK